MTHIMEQSFSTSRRNNDTDFSSKERANKARISRENTHSRRFSASNLRSFGEDAASFRSNMAISSTASSPGRLPRDEFDPTTYSFTSALKELQAKALYTWEYPPTDHGTSTLSSKWNEAEKYISNPFSGEVPLECLSAKTLSGRSFRSLTGRISMSAPLVYTSNMQQFLAKSPIREFGHKEETLNQEKKPCTTRDVGTQSSRIDAGSSSPSPAATPSIEERSRKHAEVGADSSVCCSEKSKSETEIEVKERAEKQCRESEEGCASGRKQVMFIGCINSCGGGQRGVGCLSELSFKGLWMRTRQRQRLARIKKHLYFLYRFIGFSRE